MELEPINFLGILARCQPLSVLKKDVDVAFFDEEFEVQGRVALRHCRIVQDGLALCVPSNQIELVTIFARLAMRPQDLN